jgi:hypothetical protein
VAIHTIIPVEFTIQFVKRSPQNESGFRYWLLPALRWMADCMTVKEDVNGNVRPVKPERLKSSKRIDGMVALIMAMSRAMNDDSPRSIYNYQGLRWVET